MNDCRYYLVVPLSYGGNVASFTYDSPSLLEAGQIVTVPLGQRRTVGVVTKSVDRPNFATKPISQVLDMPNLPPDLMSLAQWMSDYYEASPSSVLATMLPTGIAKARRSRREKSGNNAATFPSSLLTDEQSLALKSIDCSDKATTLIQGVTGSGKTRIYLELARKAVADGKSVIVLVPEITLTPQVVGQFERAFGGIVLSSHSKLTEAARHDIWNQAAMAYAEAKPRILVGPRSILFMPAYNLGLVVIDECHETSYKQEQQPRYQAAAVAAKRIALTGAKLILGSATPGLSELYLARVGRIHHVRLTKRVNQLEPQPAKILDLREKSNFVSSKFIAQPLINAILETLAEGRQSLLYLNRRGSASSQVCADCGHITDCPNCSLPLTFHADLMRLVCHHCNYRKASPAVCPDCGGADLKFVGSGTKRIESEIMQLFPSARIARLDRDSATLSHIQQVYEGLKDHKLDIVIGTQMIAKGLDLPAIDTVGVISADTMLHLPDYTAAERTYQLLSQVSGRAGRGDRPGRVYIQTYTPNHAAIVAASTGDYEGFAAAELPQRQLLGYPPYSFLLKLTVATTSSDASRLEAGKLASKLQHLPGLTAVGPAPAFIEHLGGKYRWVITVKSPRRPPLIDIARNLPSKAWSADLDPVNLL